MGLRFQLPARSPLSARALMSGGLAVITPQRSSQEREALVVRQLIEHWGSKAVLLTDSGTSALALALRVTAGDSGRPVAIPAYGCFDIATAVDAAGVPFVFYDVDPATLGPDMQSLRRSLMSGADRILAVHFYGLPVDIAAVKQLAAEFGALLLEDAAQGAGTTIGRAPAGSHGALAVLSFGRGKGVTGGGGGALLVNDGTWTGRVEALATKLGRAPIGLREFAKLAAQWVFARPALFGIPSSLPFLGLGETVYREPHAPYAPSGVSLAMLPYALLADMAEGQTRRQNAAYLLAAVNRRLIDTVLVPSESEAGYLRLPLAGRAPLVNQMDFRRLRSLGVMRGYPSALANLPGFCSRSLNPSVSFNGAESIVKRLFTMPVHGALDRRDLSRLAEWCANPT